MTRLRILPASLLALSLLFAPGCSSNCQQLCTAWYDYQRDVCGQVNTDDDRVTCISDYRASQSTDQELSDCSERISEVNSLRSASDASCCTWDLGSCPSSGDDDDSAKRR
ncbi:MAG: hypothetical protein KDA24_11630 [Deltaproteobacteria bacterium]|nr:hypothetical protein [Deltaproteobacteria bacterium]